MGNGGFNRSDRDGFGLGFRGLDDLISEQVEGLWDGYQRVMGHSHYWDYIGKKAAFATGREQTNRFYEESMTYAIPELVAFVGVPNAGEERGVMVAADCVQIVNLPFQVSPVGFPGSQIGHRSDSRVRS